MATRLRNLIEAQASGEAAGIYSVCSAHPLVIESAMEQSLEDDTSLLVEATSNQVNQYGGYTGMRPADFRRFVFSLARKVGLSEERILLGGDHLGPNPWRSEPSDVAMEKAKALVREFVAAGFSKIHLDCSMRLADDGDGADSPLPPEIVAARTADLCRAAETTADSQGDGSRPVYVVGTEVPAPGGHPTAGMPPSVTTPGDFEETLVLNRTAFQREDLEDAWNRVIAVVVQPGVEFEAWHVHRYDRHAAAPLRAAGRRHPEIVFEAHSTDFQPPDCLRSMVEDGFAILKVGPALTFALREALFTLSFVEEELYRHGVLTQRSQLIETLDACMDAKSQHWQAYAATLENGRPPLARTYGFHDRVRYYWNEQSVQESVRLLVRNLRESGVPANLVRQFLPTQHDVDDPIAIVKGRVREVLRPYSRAVYT